MTSEDIREKEGLTEEEYERICNDLGRSPNRTELGMLGVMWSEHCSYKHSKAVLREFPTEGEVVLQGPGENAGVIDIGEGQAVAFKIESHNHPSAIEPYQGAATGIGGIVRDIFTMGARPIALLDSLRFGELEGERMSYLCREVVSGISGYGNSIGVPTVGGETFFADSYRQNPLVNVMCVGLMEKEKLATATASGVGNPVMVVGAATGRDGIQGASFASDELDEDSEEDRPAVQIGDPFMEKLLLEASLELIETDVLVGIQDMGAAGLISAAAEMASRGDTGIELDVNKVPKREKNMTPYEVLLSESQERMLVVPRRGKEEVVEEIFAGWGLKSAVIGEVTDDSQLRVMAGEKEAASLPVELLVDDAPVYRSESSRPEYLDELVESVEEKNIKGRSCEDKSFNDQFEEMMLSENLAGKASIYEQYDHMVQINTVVPPGSDAAVLRLKGRDGGLALTTDCNGRYCYLNPRRGAALAVAEAARNLSCSGAEPLAITNGLNFGSPEKSEVYWQFEEAARGIKEACEKFDTPVTGGNVSFYNESPAGGVYPTPVIGMVGLLDDIDQATSRHFQKEGARIVLLGENKPGLGGSEYLSAVHDRIEGEIPALDFERELAVQKLCREGIRSEIIASAHDCSLGGLAAALFECCAGAEIGAGVEIESELAPEELLFGESQSRIIVSLDRDDLPRLKKLAEKAGGVTCQVIGRTGGSELKINDLIKIDIGELKSKWLNAIPEKL
ncbi:phosphoribosylformylglycinamidine synthase subunit PurL [Halarsenatibacter silvermanii]|uniref:Phosphoribosylformylglycinamidine synthase subunit PurL n=1 Tax=Halarsenatibacter silvermanii TaxID=321763 RepID=A0A1G9HDT1_9FIRM|nr:phosphoribosylformylglycinamidine synthase subunit PurL [Halarsenatibacter silvermanii]SDL11012.1 phosphoribosylformylglycinamidine synthase subunit II [Halarsenatibacter silvermanii]